LSFLLWSPNKLARRNIAHARSLDSIRHTNICDWLEKTISTNTYCTV